MITNQPLWSPDKHRMDISGIRKFMEYVSDITGHEHTNYDQLHTWSITEPELFWSAVWDFCAVIGHPGDTILVDGDDIEKACWFPEARLNYAENLLQRRDDEIAIFFQAENRVEYSLSYAELYAQVSAVAACLTSFGIQPGDRIAGYLPNMPETIVAMLATASIGAVWTSTSPDFGYESVIDRFAQTAPRILICADGYYYGGKTIELSDRIRRLTETLDSVEQTIIVPLIKTENGLPGILSWQHILKKFSGAPLQFQAMSFNDPLCILYSSGTTGKPKCITHKVGGVLLQHIKEHQLHCDIKEGDRVFYFTTCGWMMWNWLVSALASGATLVLYDGSPFYPDASRLWQMAEQLGLTLFGTSAKYIEQLKKQGLQPKDHYDLSELRTICSTGSVLAPESFDYVYQAIKEDICLSSISGGTDIISCFVLGCPILPVYRGECQCCGLGMAVGVFDEEGTPLVHEKGELVCTLTFPSQPVYFWNDPQGDKYHKAYFARFPNVWHHGDYVRSTEHGGVIIYGRSDATLNPGGVRIGTAEIYRHVEQIDEVMEAIVIGQHWQGDERVVLFVVLRSGIILDDELKEKMRRTVREKCSPRHMPAKVVQVDAIPRTKSGKIVEIAVRQVVHSKEVKNINSLANPEALEQFRNLPDLQ